MEPLVSALAALGKLRHGLITCSCCSSLMLLSHWATMSRIWFSCFCCCCSLSAFCLFSSCWENCRERRLPWVLARVAGWGLGQPLPESVRPLPGTGQRRSEPSLPQVMLSLLTIETPVLSGDPASVPTLVGIRQVR